jgi:hypothetical protein
VIYEVCRRLGITEIHVIGSSAFLAFYEPPAGELTATRDVDVIPPNDDETLGDRIDWKARARPVRVETYTGWCMEPHDLVLSKLGVGREKDLHFAKSAASGGFVRREELLDRLGKVEATVELRALMEARINALFR